MTQIRRVALAYSGGLDTSVMIPWLRERHGCEVVAVIADVGQGEDLEAVREKATATGAVEAEVQDLRAEFVERCVLPALRAGAVYEGRYLLGTALARPVIAKGQVEAARRHGCDALAHGCTGKGNDQVRFELAYQALAPELRVVAPWREWTIRSREEAIAFARERGIPVPVTLEKPYSVDRNLWHTSFEGGVLEDPARPAPAELYERAVDPRAAPDEPETLTIGFAAGLPVSLDGEPLEPVALLEALNRRAGAHGVGWVDLVENRLVGMKSRGVYETPGGTVLMAALRDLESLVLDRDTAAFKEGVARRYAELVYQGLWFSPLREALDGFLEAACRHVTGTVTVRLYKGSALPVARSAPRSLYREDLVTFGEDAVYDHADAGGFIRLWGLRTRVHAAVHGAAGAVTIQPPGPRPSNGAGPPGADGRAAPTAENAAENAARADGSRAVPALAAEG